MSDHGIDKISDIIHGRLRLGVMAFLANAEAASFTELKTALSVTSGNLSIQMRKLEEAGYIKIDKSIVGRKPLTTIRMTAAGRKAFAIYIEALSDVLGGALKG
ncbi:transcriptional regulator [Algimonas ampicilliniresistens]|uniref:Transcriptional regulator n=1 Tax=Algimonas ampicilliniresistens TaxID=1298735 RepID=A0ABQ5V6Q6_9PROT|nr:transcriptional regulator [Algimonas ampicilliniresistens]GLQ22682.1 transcriptional regulator [Algimonas ampicilliniresistens]